MNVPLLKLIFFGYDDTTINFTPALLYYIINILLYARKNDEDSNIVKNEYNEDLNNSINIMQKTVDNAKRDLKTGIKKEQLDNMLKNGHITQEGYNEILEGIKILEMLANFDMDKFKNSSVSNSNSENNSNVENNDIEEYDEDLEDMYSDSE